MATCETKTKKVIKEVDGTQVEGVVLTLSNEEANALSLLLANVEGSLMHSPRHYIDSIAVALSKIGYKKYNFTRVYCEGSIDFIGSKEDMSRNFIK